MRIRNSTKILILLVVLVLFLLALNWLQPHAALIAPTPAASQAPHLVLPGQSGVSTSAPLGVDLNDGTFSATQAPPSLSGFYRTQITTVPAVTAQRYLVGDLLTQQRFAELGYTNPWPLASVTKLMTAVISIQEDAPQTIIHVMPQDFPAESASNPQFIKPGEEYTQLDLLHLMLLASSNEAAEALAGAQNRTAFLAKMNAQAQAWGMTSTHYDDPSGLSSDNITTIHDLQLLALHVYEEYPQILAVTRTPQMSITELQSGKESVIMNINQFAGRSDFIGGKTGTTDEAGENLLSIFSDNGRPVLIIVMGSSNRFVESENLWQWFESDFAPLLSSPQSQ